MAFRPAGMSEDESEFSDEDGFYISSKPARSTSDTNTSDSTYKIEDIIEHITPEMEARLAITESNGQKLRDLLKENPELVFYSKTTEDEYGWTLLHYAATEMKAGMIYILLDAGSKIEDQTNDGFTPLLALSCTQKDFEFETVKSCVEAFLSKGANVLAKNHSGMNLLIFAANDNLPELVRYYISLGIDVNEIDFNGRSALHHAANFGHGKIVRILVEAGADTKIYDDDGMKPFELALNSGFNEISNALYLIETTEWSFGENPELASNLVDKPKAQTISKKTEDVKMFQVDSILNRLDLASLSPIFKKNDIYYHNFLRLTDEDLIKIGVTSVGHRLKILDSIRSLHNVEWSKISLNTAFLNGLITGPEVVCLLNEIRAHVEMMSSTMSYLRGRVEKDPDVIRVGSEGGDKTVFKRYTQSTLKALQDCQAQTKSMLRVFTHLAETGDLHGADAIRANDGAMGGRKKRVIYCSVFLMSGAMIYAFVKKLASK